MPARKHLRTLERQEVISGWHDRKILAGEEWKGEIDEHLNKAHLILLLISSDFLASDYCYDLEMARAIERHGAGEATVIPVISGPAIGSRLPSANSRLFRKTESPLSRGGTATKPSST